jgi:glycosyltransferase involved in cell wall biosynthesis
MELAYTENSHFRKLSRLYRKKKIKNTAGISRTIQAWHMAHFSKQNHVIPSMLDHDYWRSDKKNKVHNRVGYMYEDQGTEQRIQEIAASLKASNLDLEFYPVQGPEWEIKQKLHTCNVFLSMNQGKDPLWGEGCPITIIEAMNAGCVVIGYELIGNREIIIDNYNGFIVHNQSQSEVCEKLIHLFRNPEEIERIRSNSYTVLDEIHKLEDRWPVIKEFLDL